MRVSLAVTLATATAPAAITAKNALIPAFKSRATADVLAASTAAAAALMSAVCPGLGLVVVEAKKGPTHGS